MILHDTRVLHASSFVNRNAKPSYQKWPFNVRPATRPVPINKRAHVIRQCRYKGSGCWLPVAHIETICTCKNTFFQPVSSTLNWYHYILQNSDMFCLCIVLNVAYWTLVQKHVSSVTTSHHIPPLNTPVSCSLIGL